MSRITPAKLFTSMRAFGDRMMLQIRIVLALADVEFAMRAEKGSFGVWGVVVGGVGLFGVGVVGVWELGGWFLFGVGHWLVVFGVWCWCVVGGVTVWWVVLDFAVVGLLMLSNTIPPHHTRYCTV